MLKVKALVAQSSHTLCDPMDRSPQAPLSMARILEWIAIPFSNALLPAYELTGKRRNDLPFPCNLQGNILACKVAF